MRGLVVLEIVVICGVLAGCTGTAHPARSSSHASPTRSPSPTSTTPAPTPTGSARPTAVVSVASVDVDGKTAIVAGLVTGTAEDGGTCTFSVTPATGTPLAFTSTGAANGSTTTCASVTIPISDLHRGSWTVVLRYHSGDVDSTSTPRLLEVP